MNRRMLAIALTWALGGLSMALPARAHEGHDHDHADTHAHDSRHGGIVRTAGEHHLELLVSGKTVSLWVQDGNQHDLPVQGTQGKLVVKPAGQPAQVLTVHPVGDHLEATLTLEGAGRLPVIAQLLHRGKRLTARFVVDR